MGIHSKNSSIPPYKDPNRKKEPKGSRDKSAGGQKGHKGTTLTQTDSPDEVKTQFVERDALPKGKYHEFGYIKRQVVDIDISKIITEYLAQILENHRKVLGWEVHHNETGKQAPESLERNVWSEKCLKTDLVLHSYQIN